MAARPDDIPAARSGWHERLGVASNLPVELSSFVGRVGDLDRGAVLLAGTRLLTVTGAGGCGKTRVAQRLAATVADRFPDGVWWVELAAVTDGTLVAESLARAVGVPVAGAAAADAVLRHLGEACCLVVLDNCEHVLDPVAAFAGRLLREAPFVQILCTSREPVGVEGETTWRLPSLAVPPQAAEPAVVAAFDATRLFLARAGQADPDLRLSAATAGPIAHICQRLDGIPLALELAAARTGALTLDRIVSELDDRFRLLTAGARTATARHRTLRASVEWSHALLDEPERVLLRRLGVFVGGFTAEAAEEVARIPPLDRASVLDVLTRLVDRSLVQLDRSGRYRLLETIRAFALDRLRGAGEDRAIADRHLSWTVRLAEGLEPATIRPTVAALDALEGELPNLRAALDHAASAPPPDHTGLRLLAALPLFWGLRSFAIEGMNRAGPVLAADPAAPAALRARARCAAANTRVYSGTDFAGGRAEADRALAEAVEAGDLQTQGRCLWLMAVVDMLFDTPSARATATRGLPPARSVGDRWNEANLLGVIMTSHAIQHRPAAARALVEELEVLSEEIGHEGQRAWDRHTAATIAAATGEFDTARNEFRLCVDWARRVGDPVRETYAVAGLTAVALETGRWAEIDRLADGMGRSGRPIEPMVHVGLIPALREIATLGEHPAEAAAALARTGEFLLTAVDPCSGQRLMLLGATALLAAGRTDDARRTARSALAASERLGSALVGPIQVLLARMHRAADGTAADRLVHADLAGTLDAGLLGDVLDALEVLGGLAIDAGSAAEGTRLLAAAATMNTAMGRHRWFAGTADADRARAAAVLGDGFDRIWDEGSALDAAAAVAYARRARGERRRPDHGWDALTPTEVEIVRLVATGLSNPAIAQRMFIARSTVKTHLLHVFAKLGVASRTELAAGAIHRGLT